MVNDSPGIYNPKMMKNLVVSIVLYFTDESHTEAAAQTLMASNNFNLQSILTRSRNQTFILFRYFNLTEDFRRVSSLQQTADTFSGQTG